MHKQKRKMPGGLPPLICLPHSYGGRELRRKQTEHLPDVQSSWQANDFSRRAAYDLTTRMGMYSLFLPSIEATDLSPVPTIAHITPAPAAVAT
jgi:hypothetical protein